MSLQGGFFKLLRLEHDFRRTSAEFGAKAQRLAYSVPARANLQKLRLDELRPRLEALQAYLIEKRDLKE